MVWIFNEVTWPDRGSGLASLAGNKARFDACTVAWVMLSIVFQRFSPTTRGKWLQFRYFVITKKVWQRPIRRYLPSYPAEQISLKRTNSEVGNSCNKGKVSASCTSSVKGAVFSEESYRIFQSSVSPDRKKLEIAWNDGHKSSSTLSGCDTTAGALAATFPAVRN